MPLCGWACNLRTQGKARLRAPSFLYRCSSTKRVEAFKRMSTACSIFYSISAAGPFVPFSIITRWLRAKLVLPLAAKKRLYCSHFAATKKANSEKYVLHIPTRSYQAYSKETPHECHKPH